MKNCLTVVRNDNPTLVVDPTGNVNLAWVTGEASNVPNVKNEPELQDLQS